MYNVYVKLLQGHNIRPRYVNDSSKVAMVFPEIGASWFEQLTNQHLLQPLLSSFVL